MLLMPSPSVQWLNKVHIAVTLSERVDSPNFNNLGLFRNKAGLLNNKAGLLLSRGILLRNNGMLLPNKCHLLKIKGILFLKEHPPCHGFMNNTVSSAPM